MIRAEVGGFVQPHIGSEIVRSILGGAVIGKGNRGDRVKYDLRMDLMDLEAVTRVKLLYSG